jgi:hypothetical protein
VTVQVGETIWLTKLNAEMVVERVLFDENQRLVVGYIHNGVMKYTTLESSNTGDNETHFELEEIEALNGMCEFK